MKRQSCLPREKMIECKSILESRFREFSLHICVLRGETTMRSKQVVREENLEEGSRDRISINLTRFVGDKRLLNISSLARELGATRRTVLMLLQGTGIKRLDLELLLRICRLFSCSPGDVLEIKREKRQMNRP